MSVQFGLNRLRAYSNGIGSGVVITGGTGSASVATGSVWIGGVECEVSATSIAMATGASVNTGNMLIYAYVPAGATTTATIGFATGSSSIYLNRPNVGTDIAVISVGQYGTGTSTYGGASTSGLTGARAFGRSQNCNINITYDSSQARGGNLVFANDIKHFNGAIEGTLEYASISGANLASIYGGAWASGGAGSGTLKVTATNRPLPFMIEARQVTNGVTATYRILKCYSNSLTLSMDRENYLMPSLNFQAIANQAGDIITVQV